MVTWRFTIFSQFAVALNGSCYFSAKMTPAEREAYFVEKREEMRKTVKRKRAALNKVAISLRHFYIDCNRKLIILTSQAVTIIFTKYPFLNGWSKSVIKKPAHRLLYNHKYCKPTIFMLGFELCHA